MSTLRTSVAARVSSEGNIDIELDALYPVRLAGRVVTWAQQKECGGDAEDVVEAALRAKVWDKYPEIRRGQVIEPGCQIVKCYSENPDDIALYCEIVPRTFTSQVVTGYQYQPVPFGFVTLPATRTSVFPLGVVDLGIRTAKITRSVVFNFSQSQSVKSYGNPVTVVSTSPFWDKTGAVAPAPVQRESGVFVADSEVCGGLIVEFTVRYKHFAVWHLLKFFSGKRWFLGENQDFGSYVLIASNRFGAASTEFKPTLTPTAPEFEKNPVPDNLAESEVKKDPETGETNDSIKTRKFQLRRYTDPESGAYMEVKHATAVSFKDPKSGKPLFLQLNAPSEGDLREEGEE